MEVPAQPHLTAMLGGSGRGPRSEDGIEASVEDVPAPARALGLELPGQPLSPLVRTQLTGDGVVSPGFAGLSASAHPGEGGRMVPIGVYRNLDLDSVDEHAQAGSRPGLQLRRKQRAPRALWATSPAKPHAPGGLRGVGLASTGFAHTGYYNLQPSFAESTQAFAADSSLGPPKPRPHAGSTSLKYQQGKGSFGSSIPRFKEDPMSQTLGLFQSDGAPCKIAPGHYQQPLTKPPKLAKDGSIRKHKGLINSNFTRQHHYKLGVKQESFSKKGFGVGFVS